LLSNPAVDPIAIGQSHRQQTRRLCAPHPVVRCVQDTTDLDFTRRTGIQGLGKTGNGSGRGLLQQTALAVLPDGSLLGILDQQWHIRVEPPQGETRQERLSRWRESQVWADAIAAVGPAPEGCRIIHMGDRQSDDGDTMAQAEHEGVGFLLRARHDRRVVDPVHGYLWERMHAQPLAGRKELAIGRQRNDDNPIKRSGRVASVAIRYASVTLARPAPTLPPMPPRQVWAVLACEIHPPAGEEPLEWMLLTREPVNDLADALKIMGWYEKRWVMEEWHRVEKEGCRLDETQLDDVRDIQRLAAITGIVAVRLMQLRDLARQAETNAAQNTPQALALAVPAVWIAVVAKLGQLAPEALTPSRFYRLIARRGGHVGRKHDGPPGWKTLWRGWYDISLIAQGVELGLPASPSSNKCG